MFYLINLMSDMKNLLFDLGGVIMDIRRERCVAALESLGMANAKDFLGDYVQAGPFLKIENGEITPAEFRDELRRHIPARSVDGSAVSDQELDWAFNQFLVGIPRHRLESLRKLKQDYKIYMLSNTNQIMFDSKIKEEFEQEGLTVNDYFDGIVTSFEVHASKPDARIFQAVIDRLGLKPEETLFFDDSERNLEAAREFGFETWLVEPSHEFMEYFESK